MAEVFRFPDPPPRPEAKNILRATLFRCIGQSGRTLTCAAYETEFGLELRLSYGDDLMRSELFRGVGCDDKCAEAADAWHLALIQKGFARSRSREVVTLTAHMRVFASGALLDASDSRYLIAGVNGGPIRWRSEALSVKGCAAANGQH